MQYFTDPATGRQYYIDPATNQTVWAPEAPAPTPPAAPTAPAFPQPPMQPGFVPVAPMPGAPTFDPNQMGAAGAAVMGVNPVNPQGSGSPSVDIALGAYDFSKVEDKLIMVLDPNISYEFVVSDVKGKKSATGEDLLEVHLSVCYPEKLPNGQPCKGASVIDNISMAPNALWKAKGFLKACELLGPDGRFTGRTLADLKGHVVRANVRNEEYNGSTRTKIGGNYTQGFETPGLTRAASAPAAPAVPGNFAPPAAPAAPMPVPPAPQAGFAPQPPAQPQIPGMAPAPPAGMPAPPTAPIPVPQVPG